MLKELVKVANKLDSLGLTKEADFIDNFILKVAEEDGKKSLVNTAEFFNKLVLNINGAKRQAERRGNSSDVRRFDDLINICSNLYKAAIDGDFNTLDNIFRDGTTERKLSLAIDPDYGGSLLSKSGLGMAVGRDIVRLSLSPKTMPIKHAPTKEFFVDGMEYGIRDELESISGGQNKEKEKLNIIRQDNAQSDKEKLLNELASFERLMEIRQDPSNPENYEIRSIRGRDKEWHEERVSNVISPERAAQMLEEKRKEINEKIDKLVFSLEISSDLTAEQRAWAKRLGVAV